VRGAATGRAGGRLAAAGADLHAGHQGADGRARRERRLRHHRRPARRRSGSAAREATLAIYSSAAGLAAERGIILADTKFEFGLRDGELVLADEVLTPDSSRFWDAAAWRPGKSLPSFDKQYVRDWLANDSGWDRASPPPALPPEVVAATRARYLEAYTRLTGQQL
jgi:phosphoribosylaminoimidazole-succinocarboxamide synthase